MFCTFFRSKKDKMTIWTFLQSWKVRKTARKGPELNRNIVVLRKKNVKKGRISSENTQNFEQKKVVFKRLLLFFFFAFLFVQNIFELF